MRAFDVFVMPSRSEGLCRALIEAMTLGICPVVSAAGGMKELVRDQEDGLVVPIEDEESLHQALRRLYQDRNLQKQFAASAMQRVRTLCAPDVMVDKLESIYQSLTPPQGKR
jgi:glycosyltransferase involved in cell wall biosynthesis